MRDIQANKRLMAYAAAGMYGAAGFDGAIEGVLPGDSSFSLTPVIGAAVVCALLLLVGPRLPRRLLALVGPIGAIFVAVAVGTTPGAGDGAVLYALPVLWTTLFFGRRGAAAILTCVGIGQALALVALPASSAYPDRWVDVMVAVTSVALVILALQRHNEALLARWQEESRTDALTGLLNRRGFEERAAVELAHARRDGHTIAVATFDIDHFKRVNDERGHDVGDRVLANIGRILATQSREIDVVARVGGEEFVVLLPGSDSINADAFTQRVRQALADSEIDDDLEPVRVSAGVATAAPPIDLQEVLRTADFALYAAKRAGRDRTVVSDLEATPA